MKQLLCLLLTAAVAFTCNAIQPSERKIIRITTDNSELAFEVGPDRRLYQTYFGPRLLSEEDLKNLSWTRPAGAGSTGALEVYSTSGNEDYFEPALGVTHGNGNMTTYLYYEGSSVENIDGGTHTRINMRDTAILWP